MRGLPIETTHKTSAECFGTFTFQAEYGWWLIHHFTTTIVDGDLSDMTWARMFPHKVVLKFDSS